MLDAHELNRLDSTLLPSLERHHLRLLAHGLRSLQEAAGRQQGPLPHRSELELWAARQPAIAGDTGFAAAFLPQLEGLGDTLTEIAADLGTTPLALDLDQLVGWARARADARLAAINLHPAGADPPPG